MRLKQARHPFTVAEERVQMTSNSSPVTVLTLYSPPIMEIWDAMDLGGGLGLVELP